jgi:hypothetical protein
MKYCLVLFSILSTSLAMNTGNCQLNDPWVQWGGNSWRLDPISTASQLYRKIPFTGNLEIHNILADGQKYVDLEVDTKAKLLIIKTNDNFTNFDNDVAKSNSSTSGFEFVMGLNCTGISMLETSVTVADFNDHQPTFSKEIYEYQVPLPLIPGVKLAAFGDEIIVEDIDFSNNNITFNLNPPGNFVITTVPIEGTKQYQAQITVDQLTYLEDDAYFSLTATDSGPGHTLKTTVMLVIKIVR